MNTLTIETSKSKLRTDKQPRALIVLFMTEMWERFAFYSVQTLLILYMTKLLHIHDSHAYAVFSAFGALLYATPVMGGYIIDRFLGHEKGVIAGCLLLASGYITLVLPGTLAMIIGLAIIICGNGFFKPSIAPMLGNCYTKEDNRRVNGFTIFYFGINVGATIGVISCGYISVIWGFGPAFLLAGLGMLLGLGIFWHGRKIIHKDIKLTPQPLTTLNTPPAKILVGCLALMLSLGLIALLLDKPDLANGVLLLVGVGLVWYIAKYNLKQKHHERTKMWVLCSLMVFSIVFTALYVQQSMSLMLYVSRDVNLHYWGINIPPSVVVSLNGIFLITMTPAVIKSWQWLQKRGLEPCIPMKFTIGLLLMAMGYLVLGLAAMLHHGPHKLSIDSVVVSYALQTLGELCIMPIGLAMVSLLAPKKIQGLMMGAWLFAQSIAASASGGLAKLAVVPSSLQNNLQSVPIYAHAFILYGILSLVASALLLAFNLKLKPTFQHQCHGEKRR